jgi:hypothetical protein
MLRARQQYVAVGLQCAITNVKSFVGRKSRAFCRTLRIR